MSTMDGIDEEKLGQRKGGGGEIQDTTNIITHGSIQTKVLSFFGTPQFCGSVAAVTILLSFRRNTKLGIYALGPRIEQVL